MAEYVNGIKVRVLPQGFSYRPDEVIARSTWGEPPVGYELARDTAKRLKTSIWHVRMWCKAGKIEHIRRGRGRKTRLFVKKGAVPT